jgi:hypothetical protein
MTPFPAVHVSDAPLIFTQPDKSVPLNKYFQAGGDSCDWIGRIYMPMRHRHQAIDLIDTGILERAWF